jgi:hypothetical protein
MTTERDPRTRTVLSWLREDQHENAERVLLRALDEVDATPQRRPFWSAWRFLEMNNPVRYAIAAAAVLVVALVGYQFLPSSSEPGGPTAPAPSSTPAATTPGPTASVLLPAGSLAAGTYTARPFAAPDDELEITFTVPNGWQGWPPGAVTPDAGPGAPDGGAVAFLRVTQLFSDPCKSATAGSPLIPAGDTVDELVRAFAEVRSSYEVGTATNVTLDGYSGKRIDLVVPSDVDFEACDRGEYWIWDAGPYAQGPGNRWKIWILDVDGTRLVVLGHDFPVTAGTTQDQLMDIVGSIRIEP